MNPKYFKDKIFEELNASVSYLKKALDSVNTYPEWAEKFKAISDDRYKNVLSLYAMFLQLYKDSKEPETYLNSIRDSIIEQIIEQSQKIESYKVTYDLLTDSLKSDKEITNERDTTD